MRKVQRGFFRIEPVWVRWAFKSSKRREKYGNILGNFSLVVSLVCTLSGAFLLYDGSDASQLVRVIGGAVLVSIGLMTGFPYYEEQVGESRLAAETSPLVLPVFDFQFHSQSLSTLSVFPSSSKDGVEAVHEKAGWI